MMVPRLYTLGLGGLLVLLVGCDDQGSPSAPVGTGGAAAHGGGGSTAAGGDEGDDCASALELEAATNTLGGLFYDHQGVLDSPTDRDSFRFSAEAGEWFAMSTYANPESDPSKIDTVLTLLDPAGDAPIAWSDDAAPPSRPDSEILHRFADSGSYCLQVAAHEREEGGAQAASYLLRVHPVDFDLYDDWNLEREPNDERAEARELSVVPYAGHHYTRLAGQLHGADVDWARFVPSPIDEMLAVVFTPSGPTGNGSSQGPGVVRLRHDDEQAAIIAELDYQSRPAAEFLLDAPNGLPFGIIAPITPELPVVVELLPPAGGTPSPADFYLVHLDTIVSPAVEEEPNDVWSTAGLIAQTGTAPDESIFLHRGLLPAGDEDWWKLAILNTGTTVELSCASWQLGSSLRDATFGLYWNTADYPGDPEGPVQEQTETEHVTVRWSDDPAKQAPMPAFVVPERMRYYLRVTATQYEPSIESVYYACETTVRAP